MTSDLLWPRYASPGDLAAIEAVPLQARGLPETTYALLARAATLWPDRTAVTVLPDAARWREPRRRTFAELLADVHRYANLLHALGVRRGDAVALMAPNCAELITATLAAQLAGIAAPGQRRPVRGAPRRAAPPLRRPRAGHRRARAGPGRLGHRARARRRRAARRHPRAAAHRRRRQPPARRCPADTPACASPTSADLAASKDPAGFAGAPADGRRPGRAVPHRRHHRRAEAGRAHPRQRGRRRVDAGRELAVRRRVRGVRRAAAVPRQRAGRHPARAAVQGPAGGVGRAAGLPRPRAVRPVLEDRRALPDRRDERGAHRLRRAGADPGGRRHQQPARCRWSAPRRCRPRCGTSFQAHTGVPCSRATG